MTQETLKVRIIANGNWYEVGQEIEVEEYSDIHYSAVYPELYGGAWIINKAHCEVISPSPVSKDKTDKSDEEILSKYFANYKEADQPEVLKAVLSCMSEARLSAVSSLTENKTVIPESLNDCRLNIVEINTLDGWGNIPFYCNVNVEKLLDGLQNAMLENFAAYLGSVEGLPTFNDFIDWAKTFRARPSSRVIFDWFSSRASAALASKEEQHRKDMEEFAEWCVKNYDWHFVFWQSRQEGMGGIEYSTAQLLASFLEENKKKG